MKTTKSNRKPIKRSDPYEFKVTRLKWELDQQNKKIKELEEALEFTESEIVDLETKLKSHRTSEKKKSPERVLTEKILMMTFQETLHSMSDASVVELISFLTDATTAEKK